MFDIEDSKDVELTNNKTSSSEFARIRNTDRVIARDNQAGAVVPEAGRFRKVCAWVGKNLIAAIVAGVAVVFIVRLLHWDK